MPAFYDLVKADNSLTIFVGNKGNYESLEALAEKLDMRGKKVLLDVTNANTASDIVNSVTYLLAYQHLSHVYLIDSGEGRHAVVKEILDAHNLKGKYSIIDKE